MINALIRRHKVDSRLGCLLLIGMMREYHVVRDERRKWRWNGLC